ncbi:hypothetical protein BAUCODRAFT_452877 [Baudoinia panamericana UAMH 10762]|uniref:Uncharacterized protein n=1 Tax=Baudoinia panamericana (strain UAMH 10762) TaxID=717646 RepID=M2NE09_BAUPA|nr:uncharacterized protein BAUCODRAFT_452877 [Baudoinia panamericana UAMH 10762]EMC97449.1 hypothetical protein BAUCODRAFT_452877 [Baudoinia panamericana UAMH 10762]
MNECHGVEDDWEAHNVTSRKSPESLFWPPFNQSRPLTHRHTHTHETNRSARDIAKHLTSARQWPCCRAVA